jgi:hypothetical protein
MDRDGQILGEFPVNIERFKLARSSPTASEKLTLSLVTPNQNIINETFDINDVEAVKPDGSTSQRPFDVLQAVQGGVLGVLADDARVGRLLQALQPPPSPPIPPGTLVGMDQFGRIVPLDPSDPKAAPVGIVDGMGQVWSVSTMLTDRALRIDGTWRVEATDPEPVFIKNGLAGRGSLANGERLPAILNKNKPSDYYPPNLPTALDPTFQKRAQELAGAFANYGAGVEQAFESAAALGRAGVEALDIVKTFEKLSLTLQSLNSVQPAHQQPVQPELEWGHPRQERDWEWAEYGE